MTHSDTYTSITARIMELLEGGTIPWRKPWASQSPRNLSSGKPYQGINIMLLGAAPFQSPYWLTYQQARERGGHVRKGEKGWPITFWRFVEKDEDTRYGMLRHWTVFNAEQCEGVDYPNAQPPIPAERIAAADSIIRNMPNRPPIHHGGSLAFYRPGTDSVQLPTRESFESAESYYAVAFHELIHSTGHPSRLDRPDTMKPSFGSHAYSKEELIAEMGAAMLCGVCGISPATVENSAAYIQTWLKALKDDKRMVIVAAGAAQKAADYIRGTVDNDSDL